MLLKENLQNLTELPGVSGNETRVRNTLKEKLAAGRLGYHTDVLGNLIVEKPGRRPGLPKVMLAAHMDEVGLMIQFIEQSGLLRLATVGSIDPRILVSQKVLIGANNIPGVIGSKAVHLQKPDERKKVLSMDELYLDIGASSREEAEKLVQVGDYAVFATKSREIAGGRFLAKALDDRVGCLVLLEALLNVTPLNYSLFGVFTVQEEIGTRGAAVAAQTILPDLGLALEGTSASDVPGVAEHLQSTVLGQGPAISLMDASLIADRELAAFLAKVAAERQLPYQYRRLTTGGTDAGSLALAGQGAKAGVISVPCRYIHSPAALVCLEDLEHTVNLVISFLEKLDRQGGNLR